MAAKMVDPLPDTFPIGCHAPLGEQILTINRAEREPVIRPTRIGDDFARVFLMILIGNGLAITFPDPVQPPQREAKPTGSATLSFPRS